MQYYFPEEIRLAIPCTIEWYEGYPIHKTDYVMVKRHIDHYRMTETPLIARNIAVGDIVRVSYADDEYFFDGVVEESGYSAVRLGIWSQYPSAEITDMISSLGGEVIPVYSPANVLINIPPNTDFAPLHAYLLAEEKRRRIYYWDVCIRNKHLNDIRTMNVASFWKLIEEADKQSDGDRDQKIAILVKLLQDYTVEDIIEYEKIFRQLVIDADTYMVMAAMKIVEGWVSDDSYLYFRCWLISLGHNTFREVLENPDYLANFELDGDIEEEDMLYVATRAYKQKTGKQEEDDTFPRSIAYSAGLDYDFNAPPTKGTDWEEEELPGLLPKLWEKYGNQTY